MKKFILANSLYSNFFILYGTADEDKDTAGIKENVNHISVLHPFVGRDYQPDKSAAPIIRRQVRCLTANTRLRHVFI